MMQMTDQEVVTRVLAGETALFEMIMRRYNQRLFRVVRAIVRSDADAEDALQSAYLNAYTHLRQFGGDAAFSTWLTRIAINEALGRTRKRKRLSEIDFEEHEAMKPLQSDAPSPEENTAAGETRALIEAAVDALPEGHRLVFVMREVQQLSIAETASCLDISEDNVKVRLHRAKAMLRDALYERVERGAGDAFPFLGARCDRIVAAVMARISR